MGCCGENQESTMNAAEMRTVYEIRFSAPTEGGSKRDRCKVLAERAEDALRIWRNVVGQDPTVESVQHSGEVLVAPATGDAAPDAE